ncbi:AsmA family protein [Salinarimonas sp.]|uniref:AsmA family protein n=1 Tax=Salinarimonas sp. TaxID=2766526 RepID=UPI0032D90A53
MRKTTSFAKRALAFAVVAAGLTGLVLALAPWTVSSDALREAVARQLERELAIAFPEAGRTTIAFLPTPRVKFEDVALRSLDGTEIARGGALRGQLAWGPLLYGRIQITDASLSQSRLSIAIDEAGRSPWDAVVRSLKARIAEGGEPAVESFGLFGSTLVYTDAATSRREVVRNVDVTLSWPDPGGAASLIGTAGIRGELVQISLSGLSPAALASGARSPVDLRLSGRLGRLTVTGTIATGRDSPWLTGRVAFETRSARDVLAWSGLRLPLGPLLGPVSLDGEANGAGRTLSFNTLRLTLDGDRLDGALAARFQEERIAISGTLAAETLDLTRYVAPVIEATDPASSLRYAPLTLSQHTAADLDLRLSATAAEIGAARLSELAMSVLVAKGRVETSVSRARLAGGELRGRFALADKGGPVEMKLEVEGTQVDLAALGRDFGAPWIAGRAVAEVALAGVGDTSQTLARDLAGFVDVAVGPGEFVGLDLAEALRRFERQPLTATQTLRSGRTPFQEASARLLVEQGVGQILSASFESSQLSGMLEGVISLAERTIGAKAAVESVTPVGEGNLISALTFAFEGPLSDVTLVPDAKALIQRSGAARLLLGAPVEPAAAATPAIEPAAQAQ